MGRPGILKLRNGTIGSGGQISINNYVAEKIASEIAYKLKEKCYSGAIVFMRANEKYLKYINNRKDVDPNGFIDVVAHGTSSTIQIINRGKSIYINYKNAAKLIKVKNKNRKIIGVRLLSCNTGSTPNGIAQLLANKLHVPVIAPTKYAWAFSSGRHFVAGSKDGGLTPDLSDMGSYVTFKPRRLK